MKRNDLILILSVALYSLLFYMQAAGVNFLIFSVAMTAALLVVRPKAAGDAHWLGAAFASLASGVAVAMYGNPLSYTANIISLSLLSALSVSRKSSVLLAGLYAIYSYVSSVGFMIVDMVNRRKTKERPKGTGTFLKIGIGILIILVVIIFFFLYQKSNPIFKNFTEKINLDFISWPWVRFTFLGFLLLYGFFYHRNFPGWFNWDKNKSDKLEPEKIAAKENRFLGKAININLEKNMGVILFTLLNILIFTVNALDIVYLWSGAGLPEDLSFSEFVHQGTGTLITSIIIAILLILLVFRSHMNFFENNKGLKILALIWIIQNVFIVISTAYRNTFYVDVYSLTYKRIGVFIYLLLCVIGLVTTFMKITGRKGNWFLVRKNGWAFLFVLIATSLVNWDGIITTHNINQTRVLDKNYLLNLSYINTPDLLLLEPEKKDFEEFGMGVEEYDYWSGPYKGYDYESTLNSNNFTWSLHKKMYDFMEDYQDAGWQSWCYKKSETLEKIHALNGDGRLKVLLLRNGLDWGDEKYTTLSPVRELSQVEYLDFSNNELENIQELGYFPELQTLYLDNNPIHSLDNMPELEDLEEAHLANTYVHDFSRLAVMPEIIELDISGNGKVKLASLRNNKNIEILDLSNNDIKTYKPLRFLKKIRKLDISYQSRAEFKTLPYLPELKEINLSGNNFGKGDENHLMRLTHYDNLEALNLSNNYIKDLYVFTDYYSNGYRYKRGSENEIKPLFPELKNFDLSNNSITNVAAIEYYTELESLNLSHNSISVFNPVFHLKKLRKLNIAYNNLYNTPDSLGNMVWVEELNISNNSIDDCQVIGKLENLKWLDASQNDMVSIENLRKLKKLEYLNLSYNQLQSVLALKEMDKLKFLDLRGNYIKNINPLYELKNLEDLYISNITQEELDMLRYHLPHTHIHPTNMRRSNKK